jgi:hypothetical protein
VLHGLAGIIDGSVDPEGWTAALTTPAVATKVRAA